MSNWVQTTDRFIAFLDIMGFSDYVYRNDHETVKQRMLILNETINETEKTLNEVQKFSESNNIVKLKQGGQPKTAIFSDSIIIISKDNSEDSIDYFLSSCQLTLVAMMKKGIPVKGAISYGKITADFNKSLFFGKALIDSFKLQEQLFMYGIVFDHKSESEIKRFPEFVNLYINNSIVPTKHGNIQHYTINWLYWLRFEEKIKNSDNNNESSNSDIGKGIINTFYDQMSGYPRKYLENTKLYIEKASI